MRKNRTWLNIVSVFIILIALNIWLSSETYAQNDKILKASNSEIQFPSGGELKISGDGSYLAIITGGQDESGMLNSNTSIIAADSLKITMNGNADLGGIEISGGALTIAGNNYILTTKKISTSGLLEIKDTTLSVSGTDYGIYNEYGSITLTNSELNSRGKIAGIFGQLQLTNGSKVKSSGEYYGLMANMEVDKDSEIDAKGGYVGIYTESSQVEGGKLTASGERVGIIGNLFATRDAVVSGKGTGKAKGEASDLLQWGQTPEENNLLSDDMPQSDYLVRHIGTGVFGIYITTGSVNEIYGHIKGEGATVGIMTSPQYGDLYMVNDGGIFEGIGTGKGEYVYGIYIGKTNTNLYVHDGGQIKASSHGKGNYHNFRAVGLHVNQGIYKFGGTIDASGPIGIYSRNISSYANTINARGRGSESAAIVSSDISTNVMDAKDRNNKIYAVGDKYGIIAYSIMAGGVESSSEIIGEAPLYGIMCGTVMHYEEKVEFNGGMIIAGDKGTVRGIAHGRKPNEASLMKPAYEGAFMAYNGGKIVEEYKAPMVELDKKTPVKPYGSDYLNGLNMLDFNDYTWSIDSADKENLDLIKVTADGIVSLDSFKGILSATRAGAHSYDDAQNLNQPIMLYAEDGQPPAEHIILMPVQSKDKNKETNQNTEASSGTNPNEPSETTSKQSSSQTNTTANRHYEAQTGDTGISNMILFAALISLIMIGFLVNGYRKRKK